MVTITKDNLTWAVFNIARKTLNRAERSHFTPYNGEAYKSRIGPIEVIVDASTERGEWTARTFLTDMDLKVDVMHGRSPYDALHQLVVALRARVLGMEEEERILLAEKFNHYVNYGEPIGGGRDPGQVSGTGGQSVRR